MVISGSVRSWLLLVPLIPSVTVSIFTLYHFLRRRALRTALNNHVIILLLSCSLIEALTDIAWQVHYYRTGNAVSFTTSFCLAWGFIGLLMYISVYMLMAWASIERHILIFYPNLLATKTKRFFLHYFPLAIYILYPAIFYFYLFFIAPCDLLFRYNRRYCSRYNCILQVPRGALWDSIVNYIIPTFVTVVCSIALFIRVLYRRYLVHQRIDWRNYRKMTLQLLPISALCILLQFPPIILYAAYAGGLSTSIGADYYNDGIFFTLWIVLFIPFASVLSLPDLKTKCRNLVLFWRKRRAVGPEILTLTRFKLGRTATKPGTIR